MSLKQIDTLDFIIILKTEWKEVFQSIYLDKDLYPEYIQNSQNSIRKHSNKKNMQKCRQKLPN